MNEETNPNQGQQDQPPQTPPQEVNINPPASEQGGASVPPSPLEQPKKSHTVLYVSLAVITLILIAALIAGAYFYLAMESDDDIIDEPAAADLRTQPLPEADDQDLLLDDGLHQATASKKLNRI
jgi:hypothetical protein